MELGSDEVGLEVLSLVYRHIGEKNLAKLSAEQFTELERAALEFNDKIEAILKK
jgi:hypothetical protein